MKLKHKIVFLLFFVAVSVKAQNTSTLVNKVDSNVVKKLFFAALSDKLSENYIAASSKFIKIVELDEKNDAAYYELGNANFKLGKYDESASNILKAIQLNNNNKWYWMLLAEVYKKQNNMNKLIDVFNALIKIEPENEIHYYNLAIAQTALNQLEIAKATYKIIEDKFGDSKQLQLAKQRLVKNNDQVEGDILELLENSKATTANYIYAADLLLKKGNLSDALKVIEKAKTIEPNNFEINLLLAEIYRKQKNDKASFEALKIAFDSDKMPLDSKMKIVMGLFSHFDVDYIAEQAKLLTEKLTKDYPSEAKVFALYGDVLYQNNKFKEALVSYKKSQQLNNQIYGVWEQIINIETLLTKYADAVKTGEEALSIYPNQARLYYFTSFALFRLGKGKEALDNIKNVYQLDSDNKKLQSEAYALEGDIYINLNNFSQAKTAFEKAIALNSENYLVMNNYAYYLALRDEELDKAEGLASKAISALPNSASVADTYAYVLFKQKKFSLAQTWIEKALQNNNAKNGVYFERYGDILFMQGHKEEAVEKWKKALELGNKSEILIKKINEKKYFK